MAFKGLLRTLLHIQGWITSPSYAASGRSQSFKRAKERDKPLFSGHYLYLGVFQFDQGDRGDCDLPLSAVRLLRTWHSLNFRIRNIVFFKVIVLLRNQSGL